MRSVPFWLAIAWLFLLLIGEWWLMRQAVRCGGIRRQLNTGYRLLIISDPQLSDRYSYRQQGWALWLTETYSDLYMRRAFVEVMPVHQPDGVLFLGDLFDGGREWEDKEFVAELARFKIIFPKRLLSQCQDVLYAAGNHDIGFGDGVIRRHRDRFRSHFGPENHQLERAGHRLITLDTVSLSSNMTAINGDAMRFLQSLGEYDGPSILFTHVPLWRPAGSGCGQIRRIRPPIKQGAGYQYQNLVVEALSSKILSQIKPVLVASGDDHDRCIYQHSNHTIEHTLATFSWTQGNIEPGFTILYLNDGRPHLHHCILPNQINIYTTYVIAVVTAVATIFTYHLCQGRRRRIQAMHAFTDLFSVTVIGVGFYIALLVLV